MPKGSQGQTEKPIRKRLNASQKRALATARVRLFTDEYGRPKPRGSYEPNDRAYDRKMEEIIRRMSPEELDKLMREDED